MATTEMYINECMDHLGIVARVCQEIGLATWLDVQDPSNRQQVSVGTPTDAVISNGLGFSNRQLYLVPQFFANKPVEHLLETGISADMLNDDCLGCTLDVLYAHDPTKLFAEIASRARQIFGILARQAHVNMAPFCVSGEYTSIGERVKKLGQSEEAREATRIAITYGYLRDPPDRKQWMLVLATTHDGDIPLFPQTPDGNSSHKTSLVAAVNAIQMQLRVADVEPNLYVADNGAYSELNMRQLNAAGLRWVSRVSEAGTSAKTVLQEGSEVWQTAENGSTQWYSRLMTLPQGTECWMIVRTQASQQRVQATVQPQVSKASWAQRCWHLGNRRFAYESDAQATLKRELKGKLLWLEVHSDLVAHPRHAPEGRPRKEVSYATHQWQIMATLTVNQQLVAEEALRKARFIVGINVLVGQYLSNCELVTIYKEQDGVERGFRFLKDPLFLASSVFVKKSEHIVVLSFIMVLCLLVYLLAEFRLSARLTETKQTIPNQVYKPTARLTMRWVFQCFESIKLLRVLTSVLSFSLVLGLQLVQRLILALLGPLYEQIYKASG